MTYEQRGRPQKCATSQRSGQSIRQPEIPPETMAIPLQTEREPARQLPRVRADGAAVSQPEYRTDTDVGSHERCASATEYRPIPDRAVQLAATASVQ